MVFCLRGRAAGSPNAAVNGAGEALPQLRSQGQTCQEAERHNRATALRVLGWVAYLLQIITPITMETSTMSPAMATTMMTMTGFCSLEATVTTE